MKAMAITVHSSLVLCIGKLCNFSVIFFNFYFCNFSNLGLNFAQRKEEPDPTCADKIYQSLHTHTRGIPYMPKHLTKETKEKT